MYGKFDFKCYNGRENRLYAECDIMDYYLAIDIGVSSGRHIVGWLEDGELRTQEVYRFPNGTKNQNGRLVWDMKSLFDSVLTGIKAALRKYTRIKSLAIDTWGVDYVLITDSGTSLMPCFAYRDNRTQAITDEVHKLIPFEELYKRTGIQFLPSNTIYQLYDDLKRRRLDFVTDFLMIPEYLNYMLTGIRMREYTIATTTGLINAATGNYDMEIIKKLGMPMRLFKKLYRAGTRVGSLKPDIASAVAGQIEVVLCASHDAASAVEGIPMEENNPYISSGTWSLLGVKAEKAIINESSLIANYTNEGGVGYIRYQKNIMGMWVVNRLRGELCPDKPFPQIVEEARKSAFCDYADLNDSVFLAPESMKEAFDGKLKTKPQTEADYFRCAFISLAYGYKKALKELRLTGGKDFNALYIVGGGADNSLLNELTERICHLKVKALPIEATALGNLKIQIERDGYTI